MLIGRPVRPAIAAATALGGLGAFGVGPVWAGVQQHPAQVVAVAIGADGYAPDPVTAVVGDTVTWTNNDDIPHDVYGSSLPGLRSPMLGGGESWSYVAGAAGTFAYVCTIHEGMVGALTVTEHVEQPATPAPTEPEATVPPATDTTTFAAAGAAGAAAPAVAASASPTPEPRFRIDLRLVGAALLTFALVAVALGRISPEPDG